MTFADPAGCSDHFRDAAQFLDQLGAEFPWLRTTLVHERDLYMSRQLFDLAQHFPVSVAVVGIGHVRGIVEAWGQPISIEALLETPPRRFPWFRFILATSTLGTLVYFSVRWLRR